MNQWIIISGACAPDMVPFEGDPRFARIDCGPLRAWFRRDGRFVNDQLFAADSRGMALCDGVVLNLAELKEEYGVEDFMGVLRRSWEETKGVFFKKFAGPFCGAVYDRERDVLTTYANQTGDSFVFYYNAASCYMVSNDLNMIEEVMRKNGLPRSLDETAARYLLSFGYMVDERTLFQEIKRVLPGETVRFSASGGSERSYYHRFSYETRDVSFDDAIELVDQGFRRAVRRCFEKDREYGVKEYLSDLSGGLDSRMTAWVARDMGYGPFVFMNYCQSGSQELACASGAAAALGGQFLHKQLDDASFLFEVDRLVEMNYGLSLFCGITGGEQLLRSLNFQRFGLEHTGLQGDNIIGSYYTGKETFPEGQHDLKYSRSIICEASSIVLEEHGTFEDFANYARGFMGMMAPCLIRRHYTLTSSPYLDPEFFALCMSIPLEHRMKHKLYWAWLDAKYPEAGSLPATRSRAGQGDWTRAQIRNMKRKGAMALWKMGLRKQRPKPDPGHMNPIDEWYQTKPDLRAFLSRYEEETLPLLDRWPETQANARQMSASGAATDKLMALTLLAAVKRYFPPEP